MFRTIVVGVDGSAPATKAVQAAAALARQEPGAVVHVVAAYHPMSLHELGRIREAVPEEFRYVFAADSGVRAVLDDAASVLDGVEHRDHELEGDPAEALLDVAEAERADLLVVGARGLGATKRMLRGSVSTKVMHHAPCSVLVVHS